MTEYKSCCICGGEVGRCPHTKPPPRSTCARHGEQEFTFPDKNGDSFCTACRQEALREAFKRAEEHLPETLTELLSKGRLENFSMGCHVSPPVQVYNLDSVGYEVDGYVDGKGQVQFTGVSIVPRKP